MTKELIELRKAEKERVKAAKIEILKEKIISSSEEKLASFQKMITEISSPEKIQRMKRRPKTNDDYIKKSLSYPRYIHNRLNDIRFSERKNLNTMIVDILVDFVDKYDKR